MDCCRQNFTENIFKKLHEHFQEMRPVVLDELIVGFRRCFEILSEKVVEEHLRDPTEIQSPEWREVGSAT